MEVAGFANHNAVMLSTHEPAGGCAGVEVVQGEREADCDIVGKVADDALCLVLFDGKFY